jgi:hypothetical protein
VTAFSASLEAATAALRRVLPAYGFGNAFVSFDGRMLSGTITWLSL